MKKLLVSASILAALGLSGCGGETIEDIREDVQVQTAVSRVVFDPAAGNLNIPNDLLILPSDDAPFDFTLNIPVADSTDFSDPQNALNTQDGWSTNYPFQLNIDVPPGVSLDESTLSAGIRLFEATLGLDQSDPECAAVDIPSQGCKLGDELTFGVDYVMSLADRDTVTIVPLRPLKAGQGHMLLVTDELKDDSGKGVRGSTTWESVKQDITTNPLSSADQLQLQTLVNTYMNVFIGAGFDRDEISYVQAFTTLSTTPVLSTIKQLYIGEFATRLQMGASPQEAATSLPAIAVTSAAMSGNAMEALGAVSSELIDSLVTAQVATNDALAPIAAAIPSLDFDSLTTCNGLFAAAGGQFTVATSQTLGNAVADGGVNALAQGIAQGVLPQAGPSCAASTFNASISLPYYSAVPTETNPLAPVNEFWEGACDSGIVLAAADLTGATPGPNAATCAAAGLADLRIDGEKVDSARFVTKFSPIPQMKGSNEGKETLDVQMTVPNPAVAALLNVDLTMPEAGWPVVILVHGITSRKEDMLAISGALSLAGFATVAVDQPLHGSRGFDLNGDDVDEINATRGLGSPTAYLNLASLPTARDNSRQAISDLLGLRLGLNAVVNLSGNDSVMLNQSDVSLMGVSLGAITGGMAASIANTGFAEPLNAFDGMFTMQAASLESPGGGLATFLLESPSFGPLIKGSLLAQASPEFQAFLAQTYQTPDVTEAQIAQATPGFLAALSAEQLAGVNAIFGQFAFAAQTMTDPSDPINYFTALGANTPVHMLTVVGDGTDENLPDQTIPVSTSLPLSGQLPLAALMQLENIVDTTTSSEPIDAFVRFNSGAHGSSLNPGPNAAVTAEMQTQIAKYLASKGLLLEINNTDIIAN